MKRKMVKRRLFGLCLTVCMLLSGCGGQHSIQADTRQISIAESDEMVESAASMNTINPAEWNLKVTEEEIRLPGVKGEYDILFITDTHSMNNNEEDSQQVQEYWKSRSEQFYNQEDTADAECLEKWVSYANARKVDAVFLGGDIIDFPSRDNLVYFETQIERLEMPYLYTLGNHDWTFPWEYMTKQGKETYLPLLEPYMSGNTALHTWENEDFLVIAVDNSSGQINDEALGTYRELLSSDKPVILLVHVPFITQSVLTKAREVWSSSVVLGGGNYGGIYPNATSEEFIKMTTSKDSPVELILAGHVHFYNKDYIEGDKEILQLVGDAGFHGGGMLLHITGE